MDHVARLRRFVREAGGRRRWLIAGAACALAEAAIGFLALGLAPTMALDRHAWRWVAGPDPNDLGHGYVAHTDAYLHPRYYLLIGAVLVAIIVARRRWRLAVAIVMLLGAAPVAAEILKKLLDYPRVRPFVAIDQLHIASPSWPSGHAAAVAALGLAVIASAPRRLRWGAAAAAAALVAAVSADLVLGGSHFPSDVIGGYLLAGLVFSITMAVTDSPFPRLVGRQFQP